MFCALLSGVGVTKWVTVHYVRVGGGSNKKKIKNCVLKLMYDPSQEYDSGQNGESPFKPPTYWQLIRSLWSEEFSEQKIISSFEVRFS